MIALMCKICIFVHFRTNKNFSMIDINKNYSITEAAKVLTALSGESITYKKLHYYVHNAQLPSIRILGSIRIKGDQLNSFYNESFTTNY